MLRINKLTDYATSILCLMAEPPRAIFTAQDVAAATRVELPTVSKILKLLTQARFLQSFRGVSGGYRLTKPPEGISVADIIAAIEGPIAITECAAQRGLCNHESHCRHRNDWRKISRVVETALKGISLSEMHQAAASPSPKILSAS